MNPFRVTLISSILLTSTSLFLSSCGKDKDNQASQDETNSASTKKIVPYPFDFCVVSGDHLGAMGKIQTITHNGQELKFCCKKCIPRFQKYPEKYLPHLKDPNFDPFSSEIVPGDHHTHSHSSSGNGMHFEDEPEKTDAKK